jgi:hypothetical protein
MSAKGIKMKILMKCFLLIIAIYCSSGLAFGQVNSEIVLDGPWVLYTEPAFPKNAGTTVAVLIAIAPAGDNTVGTKSFHLPRISNGDGYYIVNNGIYCLTFDGECAPKGKSTLVNDSYPPSTILPVPVKAPAGGKSWDWASRVTSGSYGLPTILILPMPDSFSDDGVWFMRFGPAFSPDGTGYDKNPSAHSIGIHLHYTNGPKHNFDLLGCATTAAPTAANCNVMFTGSKLHVTQLPNIGVLRVEMKAPDVVDACDFHVRRAYPAMLNLAGDPTSHTGIAYIDPAYDTDASGTAKFDDGTVGCLKNDPQNPDQPFMGAEHASGAMLSFPVLTRLVGNLNSDSLSAKSKKYLLSQEITAVVTSLDQNFPRISQLTYLQQLLLESSRRADILIAEFESQVTASWLDKQISQELDSARLQQKNNTSNVDQDPDLVKRIRSDENATAASNPAKDAKDCRAALMLIAPQ